MAASMSLHSRSSSCACNAPLAFRSSIKITKWDHIMQARPGGPCSYPSGSLFGGTPSLWDSIAERFDGRVQPCTAQKQRFLFFGADAMPFSTWGVKAVLCTLLLISLMKTGDIASVLGTCTAEAPVGELLLISILIPHTALHNEIL